MTHNRDTSALAELRERLERAEAHIRSLEGALEPFAAVGAKLKDYANEGPILTTLPVMHELREAFIHADEALRSSRETGLQERKG